MKTMLIGRLVLELFLTKRFVQCGDTVWKGSIRIVMETSFAACFFNSHKALELFKALEQFIKT